MHLSIDPDMNMHAIEIRDYESSDIGTMDKLIPEDAAQSIEKVIADGIYYSMEGVKIFITKLLSLLLRPIQILLFMEKKQQNGMIKLFNISKIKEQFMRFIKSMVMAAEHWLNLKSLELSVV